jgi:hypothetical protein
MQRSTMCGAWSSPSDRLPPLRASGSMQKWSKGKLKEKVNNQVLFDKVSAARGARRSLPPPPVNAAPRAPLHREAQAESRRSARAADVRQAADGGAQIQDDHAFGSVRQVEGAPPPPPPTRFASGARDIRSHFLASPGVLTVVAAPPGARRSTAAWPAPQSRTSSARASSRWSRRATARRSTRAPPRSELPSCRFRTCV